MRGNKGWSTKGRAGRKPMLPEEKRKNRTLKARDEEWAVIKRFEKLVKTDFSKASQILE